MSALRTYIFAGGGTGGHLFPGIAVAQELLQSEPDARIVFVGSEKDLEQSILARHQFEHRSLPVESLRCLTRRPWRFVIRNWRAWRSARDLIRTEKPSGVIGLGGYASAPIVWAAARAKLPVVLLEQNVIPGRTTRWLARYATEVCLAFDETVKHLPKATRYEVTGNPLRREITELSARSPAESLGPRQLLVLGGSQGADSLNEAVTNAVQILRDQFSTWQIIHQTGPRQVDQVRNAYDKLAIAAIVEPFFDNMADRYRSASLVISRAGATTLAELACCGLPMVLLPYPQAADDHQRANANVLKDRGAAIVVEHHSNADDTGQELARHLHILLTDSHQRKAMSVAARSVARPDAAMAVAELIRAECE